MTVGKFFHTLQNIFPVKLRKHLTVCILLWVRAVQRQLYVNTFSNVLLQNLENMKPSDALHIIMVRKCGNLLLLDSKYLILHLPVFYSQLVRCSKTTSPNCLWLFRSKSATKGWNAFLDWSLERARRSAVPPSVILTGKQPHKYLHVLSCARGVLRASIIPFWSSAKLDISLVADVFPQIFLNCLPPFKR